jgi:phage terminase large subunit-like protein
MSATTDLTAVVACFRDNDGSLSLLPHFFVPADNLKRKADRDQVPYPQWANDGYITATPGSAIDYSAVTDYLRELCATYDVRQLGFDRAYAQPVMGPLLDEGQPVITLQQGWITQSPALNQLERAIVTKTLRHGGNPVLRWCFENVAIQTDSAGNRTMHKGKSKNRIDGAVATWIAVMQATANDNQKSFLDSDDAENLMFIA